MMLIERQSGYKWYFKSIDNDTITLYNKHEDRTIEVHKSDIWSRFRRPLQLDKNGFKRNSSTKEWL